MDTESSLGIGELADAAGVSRRAVRFYVQRGLLPAPTGLGRGSHYTQAHVDRLMEIQRLQSLGHSLESIERILRGEVVEPISQPLRRPPGNVLSFSAELWTRLKVAPGIEVHLDPTHQPLSGELVQDLSRAVRDVLAKYGV